MSKVLDPSATLVEYELMASRLLTLSSKKAMERAARVLASYVGHYQLRHGMISARDLASINSTAPSVDQVAARVEALRVLAAALTLAAVADTPTTRRRKAGPASASVQERLPKSRASPPKP